MKTSKQVSDNILAQIEAATGQTTPLLPRAFNRVLSKALGGLFVLLYKYGGFMLLQMFVQHATHKDIEVLGRTFSPLTFWGRLTGVGDPVAATQAELTIDITVENQAGSLAVNSQLVGPNNGVTYVTLAGVLLDAPVVQATVRAVSDQSGGGGAGVVGNLEAGDVLSFANPLDNVAQTATVVAQTVTGADAEDPEAYRQRVIDFFQKRPQGGAYADYEQWGEETAGVINVYPYTGAVPGHVDLYSEATPESSGSPDGIPTTAQLAAVLESVTIDDAGLASRRSANTFVNSYPISRQGFDVTVAGIAEVDDVATVQADIRTSLATYFLGVEPFIAGLSIPPRNDRVTRTRVSAIVEDVVTAAGGTFTSVTMTLEGSAVLVDVHSLTEGQKAKLVGLSFA